MAEELGTRDVLEQVDTRLGNVEQDIREMRSTMDARFDRVDARFDRVHQDWRWLIGLFFAGWLSLMATVASIWLKL